MGRQMLLLWMPLPNVRAEPDRTPSLPRKMKKNAGKYEECEKDEEIVYFDFVLLCQLGGS